MMGVTPSRVTVFMVFFIIGVGTLTVGGQPEDVVCRASVNCAGGPGDDLGNTTERECCVNNPSSHAYVDSKGNCIPCVVVGFFNDSYSGVEQGPGHSVPVGYQKGAQVDRQNLIFNVVSTPGTAREGAAFDYTLNTLRTRASPTSSTPNNVVITFHMDAIAQETNETLTLTLSLDQFTPLRNGSFFRDVIQVTIIDSDNVDFFLTEDCYQANELGIGDSLSFMPVIVSKSVKIASQVVLGVVSLTVEEAQRISLPLPPNVPESDTYSPPYANVNDFNNTNITLIFEPDEDAEVNELSAPIFVIDDAINEATEQVFIVELVLVSSVDPATVDLTTRPSSLCRIIDDDPIRIGFELPGYTYNEPQFEPVVNADEFYVSPTGRPENGPVFLVKEDNVTSEQTFLVAIQVIDSAPNISILPAGINEDYSITLITQTIVITPFLPTEKKLNFQFILQNDSLSEGTEAFQARVYPEHTQMLPGGIIEVFPTFLNPINLSSNTHIFIEDDDSTVIGFTNMNYNIDEGTGLLQVEVKVYSPLDNQLLPANVNLVIQTVSGSAIGGSDYQEISGEAHDIFLTFDNNNRRQSFHVNIMDDISMEDTESFTLELRFSPIEDAPSKIQLNPYISTVTIVDDDDVGPTAMVRLASGSSNLEGRVEVFANGAWGTVCDDSWGIVDATVVCRQLGFATATEALTRARFGEGSGEILLDEVRCTGSESRLIDCPANSLGVSDCLHREDAGVRCRETAECTSGSVRLVNGSSLLSGRLEVCAFRIWGTVCDDQFNSNAAMVACRQLGLAGGIIISRDSHPVGADGVPIWLDNVNCAGIEASLFDCRANAIGTNNCGHNEDIGVQCTTPDSVADIVIGFVEHSYNIDESGGQQQVCAEVKSSNLQTSVAVQFNTANGEAIAPQDYTATIATFTFSATQSQDCVDVPIIPDNVIEGSESFSGNLDTSAALVTLDPHITEITIIDAGFQLISFIDPPYSTQEESGFITVSVGIRNPGFELDDDFVVNLETMDIPGTINAAQVGEDYKFLSVNLTFNSTVKIIDVNVTILDDDIVELKELFLGQLTMVTMGPNASDVQLTPQIAQISILDEMDRITVGLIETLIAINEDVEVKEVCAIVIAGNLKRNAAVTLSLNPLAATAGEDYVMESFTLVFSATVRGPICTNITILNDDIYESKESLTFNLSTIDTSVILNPAGGVMSIYDEDDVVIGWEREMYQFNETVGQSRICASVLSGSLAVTLPTLGINTRDGTASRGTPSIQQDYIPTSTPNEFVFSSTNMGPICTNIPIVSDNILDQTIEDFFADLVFATGSEPDRVTISPATTQVDIIDDDVMMVGFVEQMYTFVENQLSMGIIQVRKTAASDMPLQARVLGGPSISSPIERSAAAIDQVITFEAGPSAPNVIDIMIDITNDFVALETNESYEATLEILGSPDSNIEIGTYPMTTVLVLDDDSVTVGFAHERASVVESSGEFRMCLVRNYEALQDIIFTIEAEDDSAISDVDYTPSGIPNVVTIPASALNRTCFSGPIINNPAVELNENFILSIIDVSPVNRAIVLGIQTTRITIIDDDIVTIGFNPLEYEVSEADSRVVLNISIFNGILERDIIINFETRPNSATSEDLDADYVRTMTPLTFSPTVDVNQLHVAIIDDDIHEDSESFFGVLNAQNQPINISQEEAIITIVDNNDSIIVGFLDTSYTVYESDREVNLEIGRLNGSLQRKLSFVFSFMDLEAIRGEDFINTSNPVNVTLSTDEARTIKITIINDNTFELTETFVVHLSFADQETLPPGVTLNQTSAQVYILDNDELKFELGLTEKHVNESTDSVRLDVIRSGQFNDVYSPSVEYRITTGSSTARVNEDFELFVTDDTQQIMFTSCDQMKELTLAILDDTAFENDEDIIITLINVTLTRMENGSKIILSLSEEERRRLIWNMTETTVTILDDDAVTIGFDNTDYRVDENVGTVAINIGVINGTLQKKVMISISTENSTAISNVDYTELTNYILTLDSTNISATVNIIIETNDTQREDDEEFIVHLSFPREPIPGVTLDPNKATVRIVEFDGGVGFYSPEYNVSEGDTTLEITVGLLSGKLRSEIVLSLGFSTPTIDLMLPSMEVMLSPSTVNRTINVEITDDTDFEGVESLKLELNFTRGETHRLNLTNPTTLVTIFDNDEITVGFSRAIYTINENNGEIVLTIEVKGVTVTLKRDILLNISTQGDSAVGGSDFMMANLQIELNESVTMTLVNYSILNDGSYERTERFLVDLSFSGDPIPGVTLNPNSTVVVIMDDDVSQLIGAVVGPLSVLLLSLAIGLIVLCICCYGRSRKGKAEFGRELGEFSLDYTVQSSYRLSLPPYLIIPSSNIETREIIGQGEFGVVYKGHITKNQGQIVTETVAIKTLKGFYDGTTVRDMLKECSKMSKFDHPNVLTLKGVCLDGGPAPYIIMPFMANGNLLTYLKNNRTNLVISSGSENDEVSIARKRLQDMCLQVGRGMEYLAKMKVVHRDLAARNCMIDLSYVIKVGDFGLTESVGKNQYFRQNKLDTVKLPVRWLAPESLEDCIFSEKSDMWAYGVTCWEIFTAGKVPYATVNLNELMTQINNGYRLEKPANDACDEEMYALMLQCWELEPKGRPTFSDLVSSLSQSLEAMAGYMDVRAFGELQVESKPGDSTEKREDYCSSEKESKTDETKLELSSVDETCSSV